MFSELENIQFMKLAIDEANKAKDKLEVPIGCVIIDNNSKEIISTGYNEREETQNALKHAELIAIENACRLKKNWRLENTTLYVTLEPCPMCAGAIINSRIPNVVFGASDPKAGSVGTINNLLAEPKYNHHAEYTSGVLEDECADLLRNFFKNIRSKK
ncbi:tRNA adenosine(34) deaminase TadA [Lactobacillus terrae]|uniref:tRNA adenosine(34) deaminase TadA n=1 Tax=Lactobacillus terrae TaxID=2269374 RepID=UPI001C54CE64|nr:tRNA adenosine(34) deaminase TadA [Lactobacillus terrae]